MRSANGHGILYSPLGDIQDPSSEAAKAIRERHGYALMPEWETRPANRYLPKK